MYTVCVLHVQIKVVICCILIILFDIWFVCLMKVVSLKRC